MSTQEDSFYSDLEAIITGVIHLHDECGQIAKHFIHLPPKKIFPDYYITIETPICIANIQQKIARRAYADYDEFLVDFVLMDLNCKEYNTEGGQILDDSTTILNYVEKRIAENLDRDKSKVPSHSSPIIKRSESPILILSSPEPEPDIDILSSPEPQDPKSDIEILSSPEPQPQTHPQSPVFDFSPPPITIHTQTTTHRHRRRKQKSTVFTIDSPSPEVDIETLSIPEIDPTPSLTIEIDGSSQLPDTTDSSVVGPYVLCQNPALPPPPDFQPNEQNPPLDFLRPTEDNPTLPLPPDFLQPNETNPASPPHFLPPSQVDLFPDLTSQLSPTPLDIQQLTTPFEIPAEFMNTEQTSADNPNTTNDKTNFDLLFNFDLDSSDSSTNPISQINPSILNSGTDGTGLSTFMDLDTQQPSFENATLNPFENTDSVPSPAENIPPGSLIPKNTHTPSIPEPLEPLELQEPREPSFALAAERESGPTIVNTPEIENESGIRTEFESGVNIPDIATDARTPQIQDTLKTTEPQKVNLQNTKETDDHVIDSETTLMSGSEVFNTSNGIAKSRQPRVGIEREIESEYTNTAAKTIRTIVSNTDPHVIVSTTQVVNDGSLEKLLFGTSDQPIVNTYTTQIYTPNSDTELPPITKRSGSELKVHNDINLRSGSIGGASKSNAVEKLIDRSTINFVNFSPVSNDSNMDVISNSESRGSISSARDGSVVPQVVMKPGNEVNKTECEYHDGGNTEPILKNIPNASSEFVVESVEVGSRGGDGDTVMEDNFKSLLMSEEMSLSAGVKGKERMSPELSDMQREMYSAEPSTNMQVETQWPVSDFSLQPPTKLFTNQSFGTGCSTPSTLPSISNLINNDGNLNLMPLENPDLGSNNSTNSINTEIFDISLQTANLSADTSRLGLVNGRAVVPGQIEESTTTSIVTTVQQPTPFSKFSSVEESSNAGVKKKQKISSLVSIPTMQLEPFIQTPPHQRSKHSNSIPSPTQQPTNPISNPLQTLPSRSLESTVSKAIDEKTHLKSTESNSYTKNPLESPITVSVNLGDARLRVNSSDGSGGSSSIDVESEKVTTTTSTATMSTRMSSTSKSTVVQQQPTTKKSMFSAFKSRIKSQPQINGATPQITQTTQLSQATQSQPTLQQPTNKPDVKNTLDGLRLVKKEEDVDYYQRQIECIKRDAYEIKWGLAPERKKGGQHFVVGLLESVIYQDECDDEFEKSVLLPPELLKYFPRWFFETKVLTELQANSLGIEIGDGWEYHKDPGNNLKLRCRKQDLESVQIPTQPITQPSSSTSSITQLSTSITQPKPLKRNNTNPTSPKQPKKQKTLNSQQQHQQNQHQPSKLQPQKIPTQKRQKNQPHATHTTPSRKQRNPTQRQQQQCQSPQPFLIFPPAPPCSPFMHPPNQELNTMLPASRVDRRNKEDEEWEMLGREIQSEQEIIEVHERKLRLLQMKREYMAKLRSL